MDLAFMDTAMYVGSSKLKGTYKQECSQRPWWRYHTISDAITPMAAVTTFKWSYFFCSELKFSSLKLPPFRKHEDKKKKKLLIPLPCDSSLKIFKDDYHAIFKLHVRGDMAFSLLTSWMNSISHCASKTWQNWVCYFGWKSREELLSLPSLPYVY